FASLVEQKSGELQSALLGHGNLLRAALQDNARDAEDIMSASSSRILSDVSAALNKLNDSNLLLQRVLDASTTNLATLEGSIAQQTANYALTMRDAMGQTEEAGVMVSRHVGALQNTIQSMVEEFGNILGKLDMEVVSMSQASRALESTSDNALEALEDRRNAMDSLALSFTTRADDIDNRMRMFAQSIADTVNDTERRMIAARRAMDETLAATTTTVTDAVTNATASVSGALYDTNERFTSTLSERTA